MKNWSAKKLAQFALLLAAVVIVAKQCGKFAAEQQNEREAADVAPAQSNETDIVALVARQPSEGVTADQLDSGFIDRFGKWVADRTYANAVKHQQSEGGPAIQPMTPESVVVDAGGKRFGVVRLKSQGATTELAMLRL